MSGVLSSVVRSWLRHSSPEPRRFPRHPSNSFWSACRHVIGYLGQDHSELVAADAGDHAMRLKDLRCRHFATDLMAQSPTACPNRSLISFKLFTSTSSNADPGVAVLRRMRSQSPAVRRTASEFGNLVSGSRCSALTSTCMVIACADLRGRSARSTLGTNDSVRRKGRRRS